MDEGGLAGLLAGLVRGRPRGAVAMGAGAQLKKRRGRRRPRAEEEDP